MHIHNASPITYNYLIINNIYNIYSIKEELGSAFKNNCNAVTVTLAHSIFLSKRLTYNEIQQTYHVTPAM